MIEALTAAGLGGHRSAIHLDRTTEAWLVLGVELRDRVVKVLDGAASDVEAVGSSSVLGLLAKPIIDLVVGLRPGQSLELVSGRLEADGWIYRGDAGENGGHVFMLEARPLVRVAHLHVVEYQGGQWRNYVRLRDLLRRSPDAREQYEKVKARLAAREPSDMSAYTTGKTEVVSALLGDDSA